MQAGCISNFVIINFNGVVYFRDTHAFKKKKKYVCAFCKTIIRCAKEKKIKRRRKPKGTCFINKCQCGIKKFTIYPRWWFIQQTYKQTNIPQDKFLCILSQRVRVNPALTKSFTSCNRQGLQKDPSAFMIIHT